MNDCGTTLDLLQDFVDDVLASSERQEVEAHLDSCARCRNEVAALRALLREAASLPAESSPARDLWPSIESAIRRRGSIERGNVWTLRLTRAPLYGAVAALFLVLVTASVTVLLTRPPQWAPDETATASPRTDGAAAPVASATGEAAFLDARRALRASFESRKSEIPPETLAVIEENHEILLAAQRELAAAMKRDPGNADLAQLLAATWRREIELLQSAVQMPTEPEQDSSQRSRI